MSITTRDFGTTKNGEKVTMYTLKNSNGMEASFLDYGAVLVSLMVPDKTGKLTDVVLGFDDIKGYEENGPFLGAFIGRHANRIKDAEFTLNGQTFQLEKNDGNNNLHGSLNGYHKVMYEAEIYTEEEGNSVEFSRLSPHLEHGFPGNLDISVIYTLTEDNELVIEYLAVSDQDTIVNLTNHSYFNLSGHNAGTIENHKVRILSDAFTKTSDDLIPTGEIASVEGTPMDFRSLKRIGDDINQDYEPLKLAGGYDHNYVLGIKGDEVEKVAEMVDEESGRVMEVFTDLPGLQFYTGNFLSGTVGKEGARYEKRTGACFETQFFPNSCNCKEFQSCAIKAGEEYDYVTIYKFS